MNNQTYVIASDRSWNRALSKSLAVHGRGDFVLIDRKEELTPERLAEISPRYVFLPHWSYKIPSSIYNNYECIVFHMTDVPYGRGGSPLQNLIIRGHTDTVISALRCVEEIDAGAVYLKRPLTLYGSAEEILLRASSVIEKMIIEIIENNPEPVKQQGEPVTFRRRKPEEGNLQQVDSLKTAYDLIRMLDAEDYPPAFIEVNGFRLEFRRVSQRTDGLHADVVIKTIQKDSDL